MRMDYLELNKSVYLDCLSKNEDNHLSVNWGSKSSQEKRFEILADISTDFFNSSILDVGCGLGHFVDFLKIRNFQGSYLGIDIIREMIEKAKIRHPELEFETKDISSFLEESYDYVVMSGIFAYANIVILQENVQHAFKVCSKGLAFNSLSLWATQKEENEFYADPIATLGFCSKLTKNIVLRHDYLSHDFTIYMYK
jgi:SAM-dependent methyltransferase